MGLKPQNPSLPETTLSPTAAAAMSHSILLSLPHIRHHPPTPFPVNLHLSPFPFPSSSSSSSSSSSLSLTPSPLVALTNSSTPTVLTTQIPRSAAGDVSPAAEDEAAEEKGKSNRLGLAMIFGLWYAYNIIFNIYNKKALNVFPYPWLLSSLQLLAGSLWMSVLWSANLHPRPSVSKPFLLALLGPALFHALGHISACVSFSKVAVSFTHVVKSAEPVFSVALSAALGAASHPPPPVWLSLLPIVLGCSLAAATEPSFNPAGLWGAVISNVAFVLRNIYSKKRLAHFRGVGGLNLYGCISVAALLCLAPVAVVVEGGQWAGGYRRAVEAVGNPSVLHLWIGISGVFYHLYNQASYQALDEISPLTFSVGNTMKRVAVIVASVIVFRQPVRPLNALGSAVAVFGTFLYSQVTSAKKKKIGGEGKE